MTLVFDNKRAGSVYERTTQRWKNLPYSDSSSERVEHVKAEAERRLNNPASFRTGIESCPRASSSWRRPREAGPSSHQKMLRAEARSPPALARFAGYRAVGVLAQPHHATSSCSPTRWKVSTAPGGRSRRRSKARRRSGRRRRQSGSGNSPAFTWNSPIRTTCTLKHLPTSGRFTTRWWPTPSMTGICRMGSCSGPGSWT